jgi:hypothetical protein
LGTCDLFSGPEDAEEFHTSAGHYVAVAYFAVVDATCYSFPKISSIRKHHARTLAFDIDLMETEIRGCAIRFAQTRAMRDSVSE